MKHCFFKKAFATFGITLIAGAAAAIAGSAVGTRKAASDAASKVKFHVDVTGYAPADASGNRAEVPVAANVYGDYHFIVSLPAPDSEGKVEVGADKATVNISMTGVQSLGLGENETRSYSKTVETGLTGYYPDLVKWLGNAYNFDKVNLDVIISDDNGNKENFMYYVSGPKWVGSNGETNPQNQISGYASDVEKARAAWHFLVSKVSASQDLNDDDTHFLFKRGAYIDFFDERLVFDQDCDFLKGSLDIDGLFEGIRPYVHVEKNGRTGADANKIIVNLPEGSTLGISSSSAVLNEDAIVEADFQTNHSEQMLSGFFSTLRDYLLTKPSNGKYVAMAVMVATFNEAIKVFDEAGYVPVKIRFKKNKFHVDVTGYSPIQGGKEETSVPVTVGADVYGDYSFAVGMPNPANATVRTDKATINIRMSDVASLGVKGTRSYSKTIETDVNLANGVSLTQFLGAVYGFGGATIPVTVKDANQSVSFTYDISSYLSKIDSIFGTPKGTDGTEKARAAWQLLTSKVKATQDLSTDDTHFLFKRGAYIQIGDEKLVFDQDYDFLKGTANLETLFSEARPYIHVEKSGLTGHASNIAIVYLPQGSTLGISSSNAAITEDAFLTIDGRAKSGSFATGFFSTLRSTMAESGSLGSKLAIAYMVGVFNEVVGLVDKANYVPVTLEFKKNKFHVDVTGYSPEKNNDPNTIVPVTVNADVYGDYSFNVSVPAEGNDKVTPNKATVNVRMTDVASLGVSGTRSYSKTVETGMEINTGYPLSTYLKAVYGFGGATVPVTVKADGKQEAFTYNIAGITADRHIVGTPSETEDARAAWKLLTSKVKATQDLGTDDTHFLFKRGAYIQIGDEKLVFDQDYDFLKGSMNLSTLFSDARPYVHVEKSGLSGHDANKVVVYMPQGSTLGISSSNAAITEDAFLTVDGSNLSADLPTGFFSGLRDGLAKAGDNGSKLAILAMVLTFNEVVGLVDKADNVPVTLEFKKNKFHVDVTGYSPIVGDDENTIVPVTVNADVYGDYSFNVSVPAEESDRLTANKATVNVRMTDVASLGVSGTRSYSKTIETGVEGVETDLHSYFLRNVYAFNGTVVPVTVIADGEQKAFTYNIAGITADRHIVGTPSSTEDARAAWQLLTSKVAANQDLSQNDTHFLFKKGAYVQIGNERLLFDEDYDFFKGSPTLDELFNGIRPAVHVETLEGQSDEEVKSAVVFLPKGSTLGISSSSAAITENVKVTVDASLSSVDVENFKGLLSGYRDAIYQDGSANKKLAIAMMVIYFNQVVGIVDSAEKVPVTVEFTKPVIEADPTALTFEDTTPGAQTQTFTVKGTDLGDDITATLDDPNGAFSIDATTISIADAEGNDGKTVTVTYTPNGKTSNDATITLSSVGADDVVVNLHAEASARYIDVTISPVTRMTTLYVDMPLSLDGDDLDDNIERVIYVKNVTSTELKGSGSELLRKGYIPANTAVIIGGNPGTYRFYEYEGEVEPLKYENKLMGVLEDTPVSDLLSENHCSQLLTLGVPSDPSNGTAPGFYGYTGSTIHANRCYIPWGGSMDAKGLKIVFGDDDATGISGISNDAPTLDGAWYTIGGMRLNQKPTQKGLYIHNGKTMVIK